MLSVADGGSSPIHRQAAAFSLSRMLTSGYEHHNIVSSILLPLLHDSILLETPEIENAPPDKAKKSLTPSTSIYTLQNLILNTDPSPNLVSALFTPIATSLYTLHAYLESSKTSDPAFREVVKGLLETWARVVVTQEVVEVCWLIIDGEGGYWKADIAGELRRTNRYVKNILDF